MLGKDGFYRCPNRCSRPDYPERKWKTAEGFAKHMAQCSPEEPKQVAKEKKPFCQCPGCGRIIWKMQTVWEFRGRIKCLECRVEGEEGHLDAAGLVLPGMEDLVG